jgi:hypothetical protein
MSLELHLRKVGWQRREWKALAIHPRDECAAASRAESQVSQECCILTRSSLLNFLALLREDLAL